MWTDAMAAKAWGVKVGIHTTYDPRSENMI